MPKLQNNVDLTTGKKREYPEPTDGIKAIIHPLPSAGQNKSGSQTGMDQSSDASTISPGNKKARKSAVVRLNEQLAKTLPLAKEMNWKSGDNPRRRGRPPKAYKGCENANRASVIPGPSKDAHTMKNEPTIDQKSLKSSSMPITPEPTAENSVLSEKEVTAGKGPGWVSRWIAMNRPLKDPNFLSSLQGLKEALHKARRKPKTPKPNQIARQPVPSTQESSAKKAITLDEGPTVEKEPLVAADPSTSHDTPRSPIK